MCGTQKFYTKKVDAAAPKEVQSLRYEISQKIIRRRTAWTVATVQVEVLSAVAEVCIHVSTVYACIVYMYMNMMAQLVMC